MKYNFKSGVVFKRICEGVVNQLKKGDVLVYECKNVVLNITLNNGFIDGSIVSTSLTGLTNYEIGCLEKFMMLKGYFGNGTYKTLKGFLNSFAKREKNAIKKIENGEQETIKAIEQDTNTIHSSIKNEHAFNNTHTKYRTALNTVILLDVICLALHELEEITIATKWIGNEFYLIPRDLEKSKFTFLWFNFWLRCFNKDFLNGCKIQVGFLNHKLNKEIERNECVTSYAEYLFYLKKQVKDAYKRLTLKGGVKNGK